MSVLTGYPAVLSGLNLEKMWGLFSPGTKKTVRIKRISVKRGLTVFVQCFDLRAQFGIRLVCVEFLMEIPRTVVCSRDERAVT